MKTATIQSLPPKMADQLAHRARRMDGCIALGGDMYEWAQGNTVVTLVSLNPPIGHIGKDPRRADEIRAALAKSESSQ